MRQPYARRRSLPLKDALFLREQNRLYLVKPLLLRIEIGMNQQNGGLSWFIEVPEP